MRRAVKLIYVLVALVVVGGLVGGCQKVAEKAAEEAVESATGAKVDVDEGKMTVQDEGQSTTVDVEGAELPEGWPSDAPVYDGTITASVVNSQGDAVAYSIVVETEDAHDDVVAWFERELKDEGWNVEATMRTGTGSTIAASKGSWRLNLVIVAEDGIVRISEVVTQE